MNDYINREAVIAAFQNAEKDVMADHGEDYGCKWGFSQEVVINIIKSVSAANATPVTYGRWIKHEGYTECSECEYWYDSPESDDAGDRPNYCPNCGAKMNKGKIE